MRTAPKSSLLLLSALFAVVCPALSAAPRLVLSTKALSAIRISPGSNGPAQTVEAQNAGDGALSLTAASSASWLSATVGAPKACTVLSGTCNPVTISLATATLAAGSYNEVIVLSDPNAVDSPQEISVSITVAGVPDSLTLYVGPNGSANGTILSYIYPTSAITGVVTTQTGGKWLSFFPAGSNPLVKLPDTIQVAAQPGQAAGTYTGSIVISGSSAPADNKTIAVTLIVSAAPVVDLSALTTLRFYGFQGGDKPYTAYITLPASGAALNITAAASSAAFFSAVVYSANTIAITADPAAITAGNYTAKITVTSNAANNAAISIPVELVVYPIGASVISDGGLVNAATYVSESFAPGDIVALYGTQLAAAGIAASNPGPPPLANKLGNVQVLVNGAPVPLYYASTKQVNFQVPYSLTPGQVATVQVVNGGTPGNLRSITIAANTPRILVYPGNYGIVSNTSDYSLALPSTMVIPPYVSHPAKPGDVLVFYAIGFGQTSPAAQEGNPASTSFYQNSPTTTVTFGGLFSGTPVTVTAPFSGLTPSAVGLYQVNVAVPANVAFSNSLPVTVKIGNSTSNTVNIAVSANGK